MSAKRWISHLETVFLLLSPDRLVDVERRPHPATTPFEESAQPLDPTRQNHDVLITGGTVYDGTGAPGFAGDVVIDGDRITYVGPPRSVRAKRVIDADGRAVAPGFINMLSGAEWDLLADGRGESDLLQGVTLEVTGEGVSMGPLTDAMAARDQTRLGPEAPPITWRSLGQYLETLERKGISLNVASMVGSGTIRDNVLGESDVQPTPDQLAQMTSLVRQAMAEGALGVSSALIYAPNTFAKTPELAALAAEAGRCGGIYITHMRSEGDDILSAIDETISIARASGAPAEIYHLKAAGKANWAKMDDAIAKIEAARRQGVRVTADMYSYTAASTGLDASMPHWVLDGGLEAWIGRMRNPATRARLLAELQNPHPDFESALIAAGPEGTLLLGFKNDALKTLSGKTLAQVAAERGKSPEDTAMDLVIEDGARVEVAYSLMSEDNLRKQVQLPWSFQHPRTYGSFARILAKYVRDERLITLPDAIHRLTGLAAANLSLQARGTLKAGHYADIVVFDPATIQDHSSFENPHQMATGVDYVLVNGGVAVDGGKSTGSTTGRAIRGRGWSGWPDGGCRASAEAWTWRW
jgi:N-acyl-D-amino-acid deacylase